MYHGWFLVPFDINVLCWCIASGPSQVRSVCWIRPKLNGWKIKRNAKRWYHMIPIPYWFPTCDRLGRIKPGMSWPHQFQNRRWSCWEGTNMEWYRFPESRRPPWCWWTHSWISLSGGVSIHPASAVHPTAITTCGQGVSRAGQQNGLADSRSGLIAHVWRLYDEFNSSRRPLNLAPKTAGKQLYEYWDSNWPPRFFFQSVYCPGNSYGWKTSVRCFHPRCGH